MGKRLIWITLFKTVRNLIDEMKTYSNNLQVSIILRLNLEILRLHFDLELS